MGKAGAPEGQPGTGDLGRMKIKLWNQLSGIAICVNLNVSELWMISRIKKRVTYFFCGVEGSRIVTKPGIIGLAYETIPDSMFCVYLGSYPFYYNCGWKTIVTAENLGQEGEILAIPVTNTPRDEFQWQRDYEAATIISRGTAADAIRHWDTMQTLMNDKIKGYYRCLESYHIDEKIVNDQFAEAMGKMGWQKPIKRIRTQYSPTSFQNLKDEYNSKYGYSIVVPQAEDVFKWKPTLMKTKDEIKAEKMHNLTRILASPAPEWGRKYATVMTWIDNIQDTASVVYPTLIVIGRILPKLFVKALPIMGWMLLAYDLLQTANNIGRAPFSPMRSKRATCNMVTGNPFSKTSQGQRTTRIRNWKTGWSDAIQAAQVTYDWTGVGLCLGGIMGHITDLFYGAYRKLNGEQVHFRTELPTLNQHELKSLQGMAAAHYIGTAGQVFDDDIHFLSMLTFACGVNIISPIIEYYDLIDAVEDPLSAILEAPAPTDPVTIQVIREMGLNVNDGVGFPFNGEKKMLASEWTDYATAKNQETFRDYMFRHAYDQRGFMASQMIGNAVEDLVGACEPSMEIENKDTPMIAVTMSMLKAPLLPGENITTEQWADFEAWVNGYDAYYGKTPSIKEVKQKFDMLKIPYRTAYPTTMDPAIKNLWPDPFSDSEYA